MPRPLEVKPLPNYRLWLRYDDGVEGEVDLSGLVGRGVFSAGGTQSFFQSVRIGIHGEPSWSDTIELCPEDSNRAVGHCSDLCWSASEKNGAPKVGS